jgi:hypothetical protein
MKVTQCDKVLRHLKDHGSITSFEAFNEYGILRLASRINDLRAQGIAIVSETASGKNRYGETTHYSVYRLDNKVKEN